MKGECFLRKDELWAWWGASVTFLYKPKDAAGTTQQKGYAGKAGPTLVDL